jgi:predicted RNA binding protein YcfA (HicA-like mRNA interferase family)
MGRMAGIHADRMIRALERLGWRVARSRGSHHSLVKPGRPRPLIVPVKKGRTLPEGTARGILKEAGVTEEEFFAVYR